CAAACRVKQHIALANAGLRSKEAVVKFQAHALTTWLYAVPAHRFAVERNHGSGVVERRLHAAARLRAEFADRGSAEFSNSFSQAPAMRMKKLCIRALGGGERGEVHSIKGLRPVSRQVRPAEPVEQLGFACGIGAIGCAQRLFAFANEPMNSVQSIISKYRHRRRQ